MMMSVQWIDDGKQGGQSILSRGGGRGGKTCKDAFTHQMRLWILQHCVNHEPLKTMNDPTTMIV